MHLAKKALVVLLIDDVKLGDSRSIMRRELKRTKQSLEDDGDDCVHGDLAANGRAEGPSDYSVH